MVRGRLGSRGHYGVSGFHFPLPLDAPPPGCVSSSPLLPSVTHTEGTFLKGWQTVGPSVLGEKTDPDAGGSVVFISVSLYLNLPGDGGTEHLQPEARCRTRHHENEPPHTGGDDFWKRPC